MLSIRLTSKPAAVSSSGAPGGSWQGFAGYAGGTAHLTMPVTRLICASKATDNRGGRPTSSPDRWTG